MGSSYVAFALAFITFILSSFVQLPHIRSILPNNMAAKSLVLLSVLAPAFGAVLPRGQESEAGTSSSAAGETWGDWTSSTTVAPTTQTTTPAQQTTSQWSDWTSSTTTPAQQTTTTSASQWGDWTSSTTTVKPTTTSASEWNDWTSSTTTVKPTKWGDWTSSTTTVKPTTTS